MVYTAWLGATAVGATGYFALRAGYPRIGLGLLALYGLYGLDGLVHYGFAPAAAHSTVMNLSIWLEAATATALLVTLGLRPRNLS